MLAWFITFIQSPIEEVRNRREPVDKEKILARWNAGVGSTDWLDQLVKNGLIKEERHGGYPDYYHGTAREILPFLADGPPAFKGFPVLGDDYFLPVGWIEVSIFEREKIAVCPPEEQVTVMVWDMS